MPPPPPPAPPPLPKQSLGASSKSSSSAPLDRNALLSQIKKGTHLRKAETNDRSAPSIDGKKSASNGGGVKQMSHSSKANGPFPIIPPGGLFAQGIPKLRPTMTKSKDNSAPSSIMIQSIKGTNTPSFDHLRIGQLGGSRSQPPSPVSKPRLTSATLNRTINSDVNESMSFPSGNPNFPDDINFKGPAPPPPPPANQKPVFKSNSNSEPINKPTVRRSASQTNLGQRPRINRPPPNVKPPPPPKSNNAVVVPQSAPPPPPSKPPNILRRQSFGVGEASRFATNKLSVPNDIPKLPVSSGVKSVGPPPPPPPPPRNNSAPNDLNKIIGNVSPGNQWNKMNIAPPPPPPNRIGGGRAAVVRPPPPRAPAPPPPPPPQHQLNLHLASQSKSLSASMAPPPPMRVSSMKQINDFEERFKFQYAQNLPKPEKFPNTQKTYPSKANRLKLSTRRQPPPPPPQAGNSLTDSSRSVVHIQLNSGIFSTHS